MGKMSVHARGLEEGVTVRFLGTNLIIDVVK